MPRYLVTAALPYANNELHLGHVAGVYLPADIYVRFLRLMGEDAVFICGSDDYGVPVTISAQKEDSTPGEVVSRYHAKQEETFRALNIEFDIFSGTSTCPHHEALAQDFFQRNLDQGRLVVREGEQHYCGTCDRFLPDRYVEGTCPFCSSAGARGDQCDSCGRGFEATELKDPHCVTCGSVPELRPTTHWFFKLGDFAKDLEGWLEGNPHWRDNVRNFALGLVREGLQERCITRDLSWGIPVPVEGVEGKVLYVWFDAPIGYVSFTKELFEQRGNPEGWRDYWCNEDSRIVHFLGKDNIIFHAVMWPAMLLGRGEFQLPYDIPANEYLNYKGEKFSKSRGIGTTALDAVEQYPVDRLRYYLNAVAPEGKDSSYSESDLVRRNNDELSDVFGNFCHRVLTFATKHVGGAIPEGRENDPALGKILNEIRLAKTRWSERLSGCRLKEAQAAVIDLARFGNRAFDQAEPWKTRKADPERCALDVGVLLEVVYTLAVLMVPFIPESSRRLLTAFVRSDGAARPLDRAEIDAIGESARLNAGDPIASPGIIFPKLEDPEAASEASE